VRARKRAYLNELVERFIACAQAAALATGTRLEAQKYEASFDDMLNNLTLAERLRDYLQVLGAGEFKRAPESYGSVDMGNVSHVVPGVHVLVDISDGKPINPHTVEFCQAACSPFADEALLRAGAALALTGLDVLAQPGFLEAARGEFQASLGYSPAHS
jgi:metal-dependent amidase/aminoacylase/carboxypeptidase family protein